VDDENEDDMNLSELNKIQQEIEQQKA